MVVHLGAASIWVAGLATLLVLASTRRDAAEWLPLVIPRFSALALVSIALVALTGSYTAWIQTRDLLSVHTPYNAALILKVGLVAAALAVGGASYLAGGRERGRFGPFRVRILVESLLAVAVLLAAANLASSSPPAKERPVRLASAPGSPGGVAVASLGAPARARDPNGFYVTSDAAVAGAARAELRLDRVDSTAGELVVPLRSMPGGLYVASGMTLPAGSHWDATVVLRDGSGREVGRERFAFGLGAETLAAGVASGGMTACRWRSSCSSSPWSRGASRLPAARHPASIMCSDAGASSSVRSSALSRV